FGATGGKIEAERLQPGRYQRGLHMGFAMRVTQRVAQKGAVTLMGLDAECELACRRQHMRNRLERWRQIVEIREYISRPHQMITRVDLRLAGKKGPHLAFDQPVVKSLTARLREHGGREIDANHPVAGWAERQRGETGSASKIEHRS